LIEGTSLLVRSHCPLCAHTIAWHDLFPVLSWFKLKGRCRYCSTKISLLYPAIELITLISFGLAYPLISPLYLLSYFLFFSALIITIRTDLEHMLIIRLCSLYLIPIGLLLSFLDLLPICFYNSLAGACVGFGILWGIRKAYWLARHQEGMGDGDQELLAAIGAFTGILGVWLTLLLASLSASLYGIALLIFFGESKNFKLPFGPFLALGAITYVLFSQHLIALLGLAAL
jgi:leader peptidase (prepilin peptidase)/N-methyltransferase